METTTAIAPLKFAVPGAPTAPPPLPVPAEVEQPIATGLATVSETPEARQGIVCMDMLPTELQVQARDEAAKLVPDMLGNTQVLMAYGLNALDGVNKLVDRLMNEIRAADSPEVKAIMKSLTLSMKGIQGKYDLSDPKAKERYDDWENSRVRKFFRRGRNYIQEMMADMQSVDSQLDAFARDIATRKQEMLRNIGYLDQLYAENESAVFGLIYVIAVMEQIVELAKQQAQAIPPDDQSTGNKNAELKQRYADLILQMNVKVGEYKGRLFVAWSTSPQVRMMRVLNVGMAEKLNEAGGMTIPTFKLAIVQLRIITEGLEAAKAAEEISGATNAAVQQLAKSGAMAGQVMMEVIQTPTITADTINTVTASLAEMADNMLAGIVAGDQRRAELEQTIGQAKVVLDGTQARFDEQLISDIVGSSTKPLELPAGPQIPALPAST